MRNFVKGLIVFCPLALTIAILYFVVMWMDDIVPIGIPGVGLLVTLTLITLFGWLATHVVGRHAFSEAERFVLRIPVVGLLYSSIKDLILAFVGEKKSFDRPVYVEITEDRAMKAFGFLTVDAIDVPGLDDHVAVYFPQSYGWAGQVLLFPRDRVHALPGTSSETMAFILSGGISGARAVSTIREPAPREEAAARVAAKRAVAGVPPAVTP